MKWKNPPKPSAGRGMAVQIERDIAELKANPGAWGVVRESARSANPARTYKDRGCVAIAHRVNAKPARFDIYAMWPADESDDVKGDDALADAVSQDCG